MNNILYVTLSVTPMAMLHGSVFQHQLRTHEKKCSVMVRNACMETYPRHRKSHTAACVRCPMPYRCHVSQPDLETQHRLPRAPATFLTPVTFGVRLWCAVLQVCTYPGMVAAVLITVSLCSAYTIGTRQLGLAPRLVRTSTSCSPDSTLVVDCFFRGAIEVCAHMQHTTSHPAHTAHDPRASDAHTRLEK